MSEGEDFSQNDNDEEDSVLAPPEQKSTTHDAGEESPQFNPPLYIQRYHFVADLLRKEEVTSVIDFGCAQCHILRYLKGIPSIERVAGVDIDANLLQANKRLTNPLPGDYLDRRDNPLTMRLLAGSVAESDCRMKGFEAVTMVELIEHLDSDTLQQFPENVFGFIRPRLVVITTPNIEFNSIFPNPSGGFRHWDHKFEWTRQEFQDWCSKVARRYNYSVEFTGVGTPWTSEDVGFCSQIAMFRSHATVGISGARGDHVESVGEEVYELIAESDHPYQKTILPLKDRVCLEVDYRIHSICKLSQNYGQNGDQLSSGNGDTWPKSQTCESSSNGTLVSQCAEGKQCNNSCDSSCHEDTGAACHCSRNERYTWPLRELHEGDRNNDSGGDVVHVAYDDAEMHKCGGHFDESNQKLSYAHSQLAHFASRENLYEMESAAETRLVPLSDLIKYKQIKRLCGDANTLRSILLEADYTLNTDQSAVVVTIDDDESDVVETDSDKGSVISGQFSDAEDDLTCNAHAITADLNETEECWD